MAFLCACLRAWAPERAPCSTRVFFERRVFLQEACVPCPHGAGTSATCALAMALVAALVKFTVPAPVAMLHSVRSSHLWLLRLHYHYHTHTSFVSRGDKGKGNDANDDYSSDATCHPVSSKTLHFRTPPEKSKTKKKRHLQIPAAFLPDRSP